MAQFRVFFRQRDQFAFQFTHHCHQPGYGRMTDQGGVGGLMTRHRRGTRQTWRVSVQFGTERNRPPITPPPAISTPACVGGASPGRWCLLPPCASCSPISTLCSGTKSPGSRTACPRLVRLGGLTFNTVSVFDVKIWKVQMATSAAAHLGPADGVAVIDEMGFLKKGAHSAGVVRQYSGTAGCIENCQVGVFVAYAGPRGTTLLDREFYLPGGWTDKPARLQAVGLAPGTPFATKPQLARRMLARVLEAGPPVAWVTGDSVATRRPCGSGWRHRGSPTCWRCRPTNTCGSGSARSGMSGATAGRGLGDVRLWPGGQGLPPLRLAVPGAG